MFGFFAFLIGLVSGAPRRNVSVETIERTNGSWLQIEQRAQRNAQKMCFASFDANCQTLDAVQAEIAQRRFENQVRNATNTNVHIGAMQSFNDVDRFVLRA